jgi:formate hydrogenlyase subunit 3/multisubunit Na+/H+ antiporter MnhD subunit
MVSPIFLIGIALGFAFLYPLIEKLGRQIAAGLGLLVMALFSAMGVSWFIQLAGGAVPIMVQTAGFTAPLSINLMVGANEAIIIAVMNLIGLLALAWQSHHVEQPWKGKQVVLFFVMILGANGLVLTRDLFNVFVFMEITSIALYGLLSTSRDIRSYEAGFKYMIAGGLASTFYLIGVAFLYRSTGTLNLEGMLATDAGAFAGIAGLMAMVFFITGIVIELKPAFANGWALDTYQAADPGIGALLSSVITTAMVSVLIKVMPLVAHGTPALVPVIGGVGAVGFIISGLMALNQPNLRRMLGLSSIAQTGLVLLILAIVPEAFVRLAVFLLLTHALAKAAIFWISDMIGAEAARSEMSLRHRPFLLIVLAISIFALVGLPPFPSFWVKWTVLQSLVGSGQWAYTAVILIGSLLEAAYLFKWFLSLARSSEDAGDTLGEDVPADFAASPADAEVRAAEPKSGTSLWAAGIPAVTSVLLLGYGLWMGIASGGLLNPLILTPIAAMLVFGLFDLFRLPQKLQVILGMASLGAIGYYTVPSMGGLPQIFMILFLGGMLIQLLAFLTRKGSGDGLMALIMGLGTSLAALVISTNALEIFLSWELMTVTSFLLVIRGRKASAGAMRYIMFSLFSAYSLLVGVLILNSAGGFSRGTPWMMAFAESGIAAVPGAVFAAVLIALAALIKLGNIGVHLWLPASYAEAEDDVSSLLSSVLSKAGILLLMLFGGVLTATLLPGTAGSALAGVPVNSLLGWVGAITAVAGAMMALFQEDIKYTLAYSSMGQIGYIVLAMATMTHLGYVSSLYLAITHLLFKGMLWLAVLGVIQQTGTRLMYRMGGLIKKMPFSFLSVLFAIIAVSGVPPLSGFGGKWLLYTALMEKGWYLQAAIAMFSSGVAFLYLYRLIHSMFLGQPKDNLQHVTEAPAIQLIPQFVFMGGIMAISMYPNLLIKPLQAAVEQLFASDIAWEGYSVISSLGYWNGNAVMYVTMGVFALPLILLVLANSGKKLVKVKQFNIVYAAERPYKPETTHYAFNFFAHYEKALGFLATPWTTRFWTGMSGMTRSVGDGLRRWNTGNAQTYGFQILLYLLLVLFFATRGGM